MNCDDVRARILAGEHEDGIGDHVADCDDCAGLVEQLERGSDLLSDEILWIEPSSELEDSIMSAVTGLHESPATNVLSSLPTIQPQPASSDTETDQPRPSGMWAILGVAAVIIVAIASIAVINAQDGPDWTVNVAGGSAAPESSAVVDGWNTDGGTRMVFNAEGLAPAPDGFFYEFWLSNEDLHISGGTFTGTKNIDLWIGVSRRDFPRIWITLEPIDNDESPSSTVVLDTGSSA